MCAAHVRLHDRMTAGCTQVIDVCRAANPRLVVKRARFSALVRRELERSVAQLVEPDGNASAAVDARQEIDLRIGASFTRFQTLLLQVLRNKKFVIDVSLCRPPQPGKVMINMEA